MKPLLGAAGFAALVLLLLQPLTPVRAQSVPDTPSIDSVTAADTSLTISWSAPADDGGETITAYDLRYIETDTWNKFDEDQWTLVETIWSSGTLEYELAGLTKDVRYDLQLRAVNAIGDGAWTPTTLQATNDHPNSKDGATPITLDSATTGYLDPNDDRSDFFTFTLTASTEVWIYTTGNVDTRLTLRNSSDSIIWGVDRSRSLRSDGMRNAALQAVLEADTYSLDVWQWAAADLHGPYMVHVVTGVTPGDSFDTATTVTAGVDVYTRFVNTEDSHYYTFEVASRTAVWMRSAFDAVDTTAVLYDGNQAQIDENDDSPGGLSAQGFSMLNVLDAGTYYLKVETFSSASSGPYILEVDFYSDGGNTTAGAPPAEVWSAQLGLMESATDVDYYRLGVHVRDWVRIHTWLPDDGSLSMRLLDREGQVVNRPLVPTSDVRSLRPFDALIRLSPGTYYIEVSSTEDREQRYLLWVQGFSTHQTILSECDPGGSVEFDPFYGCQWHLNNTRQYGGAGQDINVEEVWETNKGEGVNVAIVDSGMQYDHPDLEENVITARNHSYVGSSVYDPNRSHGTAVAGLVAARDNERGVRGVAPRASLYAFDLLRAATTSNIADAMTRQLAVTAVSNNSWGFGDGGRARMPSSAWEAAVERGVSEGNGGRGISYVWAAGNGNGSEDHANLDGRANHHAIIAVCGINHRDTRAAYSERGPNLWVCAPTLNDRNEDPAITTTTTRGKYTTRFSGTSASSPIAAGVVALVRAANPELSWRDVKLILAASARQNDSSDGGWRTGALHYGPNPDSERYTFNNQYGFGAVDAGAAVALAADWPRVPEWRKTSARSTGAALAIPDQTSGGTRTTVTSKLTLEGDVDFIEYVEVMINMEHGGFRDLDIDLVSPSGAVSSLTWAGDPRTVFDFWFLSQPVVFEIETPIDGTHRLGTARHLGEDADGEWTLRITDKRDGDTGRLRWWEITAYGHGNSLGAPAIDTFASADTSLTVTWQAPGATGMSDVTGYDVRYLREDATDRQNASWTVLEDVWTSGDPLSYEITSLTMGYRYDVQVRAVNDEGAGPWSRVRRDATNPVRPDAPAFTQITTRTGSLEAWWQPNHDGAAVISSYDLRYIRTDATEREDDNWTLVTGAGLLRSAGYRHRVTPLDNDVSYDLQVRAHNGAGTSDWSEVASGTPQANVDPTFDAAETGMRSVPENTIPGTFIGEPLAATDPNPGATLRFSIQGGHDYISIHGSRGHLRVKQALDHESAASHTFTVRVSDDINSEGEDDRAVDDTIEVRVTVTDVNEGFDVVGPSAVTWKEADTGVVGVFTATDPEGEPITWSLEGDDASLFSINSRGQLRFLQAPDFEAPGDADTNNIYGVIVVGTEESGVNKSFATLEVTVEDSDERPVVTGPVHVELEEHAGTRVGNYTVHEPEGEKTAWGDPGGADGAMFTLHGNGTLMFKEPPDFEARADADGDNVYEVTIGAADITGILFGQFSELDVEVRVRNVNEPPVITGPAGPVDLPENGPGVVGDYAADDPDEDDDTVILELGGDDSAAFTFTNGRLAFASSPDFEAFADFDADNEYEVTLTSTDGDLTTTLDLAVRVANEDEDGTVALPPGAQPQEHTAFTATLGDPDGVVTTTWTWERSQNRSTWTQTTGPAVSQITTSTYTPVLADVGSYIRATAEYTDGHGPGKETAATSSARVRAEPVVNTAPYFTETNPVRSVPENARARAAVGGRVTATDDDDGDTVGYELDPDSDLFTIDQNTGQIRVKAGAVLDHETASSHTVTVRASDSSRESATVVVTINVADVNEPPEAMDDNAATFEDTAALVDVLLNDRDPEGEPLTISFDRTPQFGTAEITAGNLISYLPDPNTHGIQRFSYRVSDGIQSATGEVTVRVEPVNDDPVFPAATAEREVDELAAPGDPVGDPVAATDVDGDSITYSLTGSDLFTVEPHNGQIMVAEDVLLDARAEPVHVVELVVDDQQGGVDTIEVTITVLEAVVEAPTRTLPVFTPVVGGGGGAGGVPTGPEPSEADFEWTVEHDLEPLDSGHRAATGAWSDGEAAWVLDNPDGAGDAVYAYDLGSGERDPEREFALAETNRAPRGIWSDGETAWVSDSGRERLFAYDLDSGERDPERELGLAPRNDDARGIWSDGETMWVLDDRRNALFAYGLQTGEPLAGYELDPGNDQPQDLWSDGVALWVSNHDPKRLFAYRLPSPADDRGGEDLALERAPGEDFTEPGGVGNNSPRGIWAGAGLMYVVDANDRKVYSYNMPDAWDARLASLALPGVDIGAFDPETTEYEGVPAAGVTETTVEAAAEQEGATVAVEPADADGEAAGHQVALAGVGEITVTVTSEDGSRERVYRVVLAESGPPADCLRASAVSGRLQPRRLRGRERRCARGLRQEPPRHGALRAARGRVRPLHPGRARVRAGALPRALRGRRAGGHAAHRPERGPGDPGRGRLRAGGARRLRGVPAGRARAGLQPRRPRGGERRCARGLRRGARRLRALRAPGRRVGPLHPRGARARERSLPRAVRRGRPPRHAARRPERLAPEPGTRGHGAASLAAAQRHPATGNHVAGVPDGRCRRPLPQGADARPGKGVRDLSDADEAPKNGRVRAGRTRPPREPAHAPAAHQERPGSLPGPGPGTVDGARAPARRVRGPAPDAASGRRPRADRAGRSHHRHRHGRPHLAHHRLEGAPGQRRPGHHRLRPPPHPGGGGGQVRRPVDPPRGGLELGDSRVRAHRLTHGHEPRRAGPGSQHPGPRPLVRLADGCDGRPRRHEGHGHHHHPGLRHAGTDRPSHGRGLLPDHARRGDGILGLHHGVPGYGGPAA